MKLRSLILAVCLLFASIANAHIIDENGYLYQDDGYSCGPIAVVNSMKYFGIPINEEWLAYSRNYCTRRYRGLYSHELAEHLKIAHSQSNVKVYRFMRHTIKRDYIDKYLHEYEPGNDKPIIIIAGRHRKYGNKHYFLILGRRKEHYIVANAYRNEQQSSLMIIDYAALDDYLENAFELPMGWLLTK